MKKWNKKLFCILAIVFFAQFCKSYAVRFNNAQGFLEDLYTQLVLFLVEGKSLKAYHLIKPENGPHKLSADDPAATYEELFYPSGTLVEGLGDNRNAASWSTLMEREKFVDQLHKTFLLIKYNILTTNAPSKRELYNLRWAYFLDSFICNCVDAPGPWKELIDANEISFDRFMKLYIDLSSPHDLDDSIFLDPPSFLAEDNEDLAKGLTEVYWKLKTVKPDSNLNLGPSTCTPDIDPESWLDD